MEYIYNENRQELIEKLLNYKLTKNDEKALIENFLKANNISMIKGLFSKLEQDEKQMKYKNKFIRNILLIIILTIVLGIMGFGAYYYFYLISGISSKVIFAVLVLVSHIVLVTDLILLFYSNIILKNNIINKMRKYYN
ncbi:MAG: hypothetical protein PHQ32_00520 [Firmicutes bacterium]|nr:hypothetical protein [Bacillota bacterium]